MTFLQHHAGLYTDQYELTMAQAYLLRGKKDTKACFDYFFRKAPFKGSYTVFAGLYEFLETLGNLRFEEEDLRYLQSIGFKKEFIDYLKNFSFSGNVYSVAEGEVVFPNEPLIRVEGNIIEAQLVETLLLNILNFQSLIATKASRIRHAAGNRLLMEFGLRRAQGLAGIQATKASVIGGFESTSNVYGAYLFDITSSGTLAHAFIQSYDDELTAFREFVAVYPEKATLLVDTYDTLKSGVPHAIQVAKEMEQRGEKLFGIRMDSGDLAYLSKKGRHMLDEAGLNYVKIIASNQLDEYIITSLLDVQKAPIDGFGVGTSLVTGKEDGALDGVYKLTAADHKPRIKISEDTAKILLPGEKKVYRYIDGQGKFYADGIMLNHEDTINVIYHPHDPDQCLTVKGLSKELLLKPVMQNGKIIIENKKIKEIAAYAQSRLQQLEDEFKRFENPHIYKVGASKELLDLRTQIIKTVKKHESITDRRCPE